MHDDDRLPDGRLDVSAIHSGADIARLLRDLRRREARQRGDSPLTYRELAAKTGWSHSLIARYFTGQALPQTDRFDALVQLLGATPAELGALATARDRVEEHRHSAVSDPSRPIGLRPTLSLVPRALPAPPGCCANPRRKTECNPGFFAGRAAELRTLDAALQVAADGPAGANIVVIEGTAGVGKTALAVHWAHLVADRFPDGQLYVNLQGFHPAGRAVTGAEAIRFLLDALRVPADRLPASYDAQAALYRTLLAGKRMLMVLDNAQHAGQVRPLLPGTPECLVLVTSRDQLAGLVAIEGARPLRLDLLSVSAAIDMLAGRLGAARTAAEPDAVRKIVIRSARLPLALAVVAARAAVHPHLRLATLAAELADRHGEIASDVAGVFSWSYHSLGPDAARLFRMLGLHPGPDITALAAASLTGLPLSAVRPLLAEITGAHLILEHVTGRFAFHDLLRDYATAQSHAIDPERERRAATRRLLDHYVRSAFAAQRLLHEHGDPIALDPPEPGVTEESPADLTQALHWFGAEHAVLLAVIGHAAATRFDAATWQLVWALRTYLDRRAHWHDLIAAGNAAMAAAQRLADPAKRAFAHRLLAHAHHHLGDHATAVAGYQRALAILDDIDHPDADDVRARLGGVS